MKGDSDGFYTYLFSAFVSDLVLPIFYIFVPLLAYRLGADPLEIGIVGGGVYATYFFLPVMVGRFSDRLGTRKLFVVIALSILAAVSFVYAVAANPVTLIVGRLFEGVAWAIMWPTLMAGISHGSGAGRDAKRSLSLYNSVWSSAAVLGPPVGSLLVFLVSYRTTFYITSLLLVATVVVNVLPRSGSPRRGGEAEVVEETGSKSGTALSIVGPSAGVVTPTAGSVPSSPDAGRRGLDKPQRRPYAVAFYVTANALSSMTWVILFTFFSPFSESIGISVLLLGAITLAAPGGRFLSFIATTRESFRIRLVNKKTRNRNLLVSLAVLPFSGLLFLIPAHVVLLYVVSFAIIGIVDAIVGTIAQVGLIAEAETSKAGAASGLFEASTGIASLFGPTFAGAIAGTSLVVPFLFPAIGVYSTLLGFGVVVKLLTFNRGRPGKGPSA